MSLKVDQAWADEYLKKKGGSSSPSPEKKKKRDPPVLPADPPMAGSCDVPDMKEGDPCRRCGSGLPARVIHIRVCDQCEAGVMKRLEGRR